MIKIFYDTETTGLEHRRHCIHQLAGCVEVDGEVRAWFDFRMAPHPKAEVLPEALTTSGVTEAEIRAYPTMERAFNQFKTVLSKFIDPYNPKQKAFLVGYNNWRFDDDFLRILFHLNGDKYFGSWFWHNGLDVMVLASQYLLDRRVSMPSFKLKDVARELGLDVDVDVDETDLHDAIYDVKLTRSIYRIVTKIDIEI
jgi:DNA polymerase-3 subunit epsilon